MRDMRNTCRIIILINLAALFFTCGAIGLRHRDREDDPRMRFEHKLGEMGLLQDEGIVTSAVPAAEESNGLGEIDLAPRQDRGPSDNGQYFAAQVFASKSNIEAKEFMESIESLFQDEVRIDYQAPYYRVCVGNADDYEEAQALLKRVNGTGFSKAWLVKLRR
jgi:SPOR domain